MLFIAASTLYGFVYGLFFHDMKDFDRWLFALLWVLAYCVLVVAS